MIHLLLASLFAFIEALQQPPFDLDHLWRTIEDASPYVLAILLALTALAKACKAGSLALQRWAATTPATWDDEAASRLVRWTTGFARGLEWIEALLPRIGFGRRGGPGAGALVILVALSIGSTASACSAGPQAQISADPTAPTCSHTLRIELERRGQGLQWADRDGGAAAELGYEPGVAFCRDCRIDLSCLFDRTNGGGEQDQTGNRSRDNTANANIPIGTPATAPPSPSGSSSR